MRYTVDLFMYFVCVCVGGSYPPCQHGADQGNEAPVLEEVEALHQLTDSPSDLDCSWTGKDAQTSHEKSFEQKRKHTY